MNLALLSRTGLLCLFSLLFINSDVFAQGMSINQSGNPPHPSAGLDVDFNDRGMLIPRMTEAERDSIQSPALGLQIFNTTTNCLNLWSGTTWRQACYECGFQVPTVSNSGPICEGDTLFLTATSVGGATYSWTGPNGFSSSLQNPVIPNATQAATGTYDLVVTVTGCSASPISTQASVITVPNSPVPGSNSPVCSGDSLNLTASSINNATYAWTGPNGFSSSMQNPVLTNVTTSMAGTYNVTATVNGCTSPSASVSASINQTPAMPVAGSNSPVNKNSTINLTATTVAGATYQWSGPNGFSSTNQNPSIVNAQTTNDGVYSVVAIANSCTSAVDTEYVSIYVPPFEIFSSSGTFTVPPGVTSVRVLAIGGGGGGANGHQGGGGSGYVSTGTFAVSPGQNIAVTVGQGGDGADQRNDNNIVGLTSGTSSSFGAFLTANGGGVTSGVNQPGGSGGSGGGGSCNGGSPGGNGGTNGNSGGSCSYSGGSGQGGSFSSFFGSLTRNTVSAGPGGSGGNMTHSGGGGGGGIRINGSGPSAGDGNAGGSSGQGGEGYGAGGGGGGYQSGQPRYGGGDGANGVVYIEW